MAKILLVEDGQDLSTIVCAWLAAQQQMVEAVHTGTVGAERLRFYEYDVVIRFCAALVAMVFGKPGC